MNPNLPSPISPASPPSVGLWHRLTRGRSVTHHEPDWPDFAGPDWLAQIMTVPVTDRYHSKQGRSIGRWTLHNEQNETLIVYLKRHYILPRWKGIFAAFWSGKAWSPGLEEWEHLQWARASGLPVPRTTAVGELLTPWGKLQSFLAVEELRDMLPLHEAIPLAQERLSSTDFARWKRGLILELARLSCELHRRRAFHRDLYLCHFYISEADTKQVQTAWQNRVYMIDFHRLTHRRFGWRWWQAKDLAQLLFSTHGVPGITPRDCARFWRYYRKADWGEVNPPPSWVGSIARMKAQRYVKHEENRRTRIAG